MLGALAQKYPSLGELLKNPEIAGIAGEALGKVNDVVDITNNTLKKSTSYDINNVFFGAVTLTQPIYMGGKIVAMNKLTHAAEQAAKAMNIAEAENVIYAVDAAYWMVVSLKAKQKLANSFVNLLDTLSHNVHMMVDQGVATRSDALAVDVKLNSAQVDLVKVGSLWPMRMPRHRFLPKAWLRKADTTWRLSMLPDPTCGLSIRLWKRQVRRKKWHCHQCFQMLR